ncbi:MAG: flagellar basal body P-ring protein FlgI [Gammaproteobacteria bacterium]
MNKIGRIFIASVLVFSGSSAVFAERVKDLASVAGVRSNQLVGYGLVVGLPRTGDKTNRTRYTGQTLRNMLARLGVTFPSGIDPRSKNVAAVAVHAELPPFSKPGQTIDVTVSSVGDATSLRGGSLLLTPLKGADGQVYAMAQGSLADVGVGGVGRTGSRVTLNNPTVGRIPGGATVERTVATPFAEGSTVMLNLHTTDFTTARRMAEAINRNFGMGTALPVDSSSVRVSAPLDPSQRVSFLSMVENLTLDPDDAPAKVIVNSRTGTVVINSTVRVNPAAVSHGALTVTISEEFEVSQPPPFSGGQTAVIPQSDVTISEENRGMFLFNPGVTLDEIVRAVNKVGATPSDLVAILEALKSAGALRAELIVI